ncbi:hypothetical protein [Merismopedia glauca]|uniref:Uncharacterized protein n=1 Tax=Merismopedia glauca CCAP 1448/3 TaxID=1296344 RepID=A0A2T1CA99_9CYAN|nr:hypothetical protein [Merismopedia glauca]PSB05088.1 hypothetical protein C7B64_00855 [Merismopedia glauca CCAP 1448/3]
MRPYPRYFGSSFDYCAAIWHDPEYKESDIDGETVVAIAHLIPETEQIKVYDLPGYDAIACIIHKGSYQTLSESYKHLLTWIEANIAFLLVPMFPCLRFPLNSPIST